MEGTDPHVALLLVVGACTLTSLLASLLTWSESRAKKVRLLEDQVVSAVRAQRERADQIEVKLGEWQVTISAMLAEVQEFFDRSVKERKRATVAETRMNAATHQQQPGLEMLGRRDQIEAIRGTFEGR